MTLNKSEFEQAIEHDQFTLHYQPIVSIDEVSVSGVEALIRWEHPDRGLLAPGDFIPRSEECEMLVPLRKWVFRECLRDWRKWKKNELVNQSMFMSINCSRTDLSSLEFIQTLEDGLDTDKGIPETVFLELHQQTMFEFWDAEPAKVNRLRSIESVELCVDDFGFDDPSMAKLAEWPTSTIKFDREFINPSKTFDYHEPILKRLIGFARNREITVIAEGVESQEKFEKLYQWDCQYAQGYYISKPVQDDPTDSMNETELESIVHALGRSHASVGDGIDSEVRITGDPSILVIGPNTPIRELLERSAKTEYELQCQVSDNFADAREVVNTFSEDIIVIDNQVDDDDEIVSFIQNIWNKSPNTHVILFGENIENPDITKLMNDERVEFLKKPVEHSKFLQVLSNQSYHLERASSDSSFFGDFSERSSVQKTGLYMVILLAFITIGLSLGYAITSLRMNLTKLFQNNRFVEQKIEKIEKLMKKKEKFERQKNRNQNP